MAKTSKEEWMLGLAFVVFALLVCIAMAVFFPEQPVTDTGWRGRNYYGDIMHGRSNTTKHIDPRTGTEY